MSESAQSGILLAKSIVSGIFNEEELSSLTMIAHFMGDSKDSSIEVTFFRQILRELLRLDPKHYGRVRDYFFALNDNLERGGLPSPRDYAAHIGK